MAFCTEEQVRNSNKKFSVKTEVLPAVILERISMAEKIVTIDLSPILTEAQVVAIGETSGIINLLTIWKAVELTLVTYYGAARKFDEVSDIQDYRKQYKELLAEVLAGTKSIVSGSTDYSPKSTPALDSGSNKKFYVKKGMEGFCPDGESYDITSVDDSVTE